MAGDGAHMQNLGRGAWDGNGVSSPARYHFGRPGAVPCGALRRDAQICCYAGFLLRQSTEFPWMASPIYSHVACRAAFPIGQSIT